MKTFLVGGAVRDELLGLPVTERDYVVVGASEQQMEDLGFRRLDVAFPVFLHPETRDEYALARREYKVGSGYKGFRIDSGPETTLEQDLARRDLTINALARDENGHIVDPFNGRNDLDRGVLRHITPAFEEDPVRLLRVARFAAKLGPGGFRIAHGTFGLLKQMARRQELTSVLPHRLRDEMNKSLSTGQPWRFFQTLHRCDALPELIPLLARAMGTADSHGARRLSDPMAALQRSVALSEEPAVRFTALMAAVLDDPRTGEDFCRTLGMDGAATELLGQALNWPAAEVALGDAPYLLRLLERLKAPHDGQRLDKLSCVWKAANPEFGEIAAVRADLALSAAGAVNSALIAEQGWRGTQFGRELRQRRLAMIHDVLKP